MTDDQLNGARTPATVELLAAYKKLPPAWLHQRFDLGNDREGVVMPYLHRARVRVFVETSHPTLWDGNIEREITAYIDAQTLAAARDRRELVIGEGETDRWTLELHGIPALGVPGCSMTQCINAEHVIAIRRIYIVREPGDGGKTLVDGVVKRLCELRFPGEVFIVDLQAACGAKDPSALHVQDPDAFIAHWLRAIERATPVLVAWPVLYPRPVLHPLALHGPAGDLVRLVAPQSEATEAALLLQCLSIAGIAMGANAYHELESMRHYPRLNVLLLGTTSLGRKGTAANHVKRIFRIADEEFVDKHFASGLISGEGMYQRFAGKGEQSLGDDKRLVFVEPEFVKILQTCKRETNTLSANIREIYDSGTIEILRSQNALKVRGVHAAVIGHCTASEYVAELESKSMANGFANRFVLAYVERANILPFGGKIAKLDSDKIAGRLSEAILFARGEREIPWSRDARDLYAEFYYLWAREAPLCPELIGAMLGRLDTNIVRLALTYALLDCEDQIGVEQLRAAIAVGAYSRGSTFYAFGPTLGNEKAQTIWKALRDRDDRSMSRTQISQLFHGHLEADELGEALDLLAKQRLVTATSEQTKGAPRGSFRAIGPGDERGDPHVDPLISLISLIS